jgi:hypothetical protein
MLVIRHAQMRALGEQGRAAFEEQLCDVFAGAYPRECRQAGGRAAMLAWVRLGVDAAAAAGYGSRYQTGRWLALMLILGVDFATDPQLPWVQAHLDAAREADPTRRVDALLQATLDYLSLTAGDEAERVVRAMLRIRAVDFAALPDLQGDAAVDDACDRLLRLYPEKVAFQGPDLTARNVKLQMQRARSFGLQAPAGRFVFVVLSFMLGSGFDHDPLHPWAGALLHAADRAASVQLQADLERAAREHLAMSLTEAVP